MENKHIELSELVRLIQKEWAHKKGLITGSTVDRQVDKWLEEVCELECALSEGDKEGIIDGIGDSLVVPCVIAEQMLLHEQNIDMTALIGGTLVANTDLNPMQGINDIKHLLKIIKSIYVNHKQVYGIPIECIINVFETAINTIRFIAYNQGLNVRDCLEHSWSIISKRKGVLIDGIFVKQEDLDKQEKVREE